MGTFGYSIAAALNAAGRVSVPVFFAIAGWVLLSGRPVDSSADLNSRVRRIVLPFAVWTLAYCAWAMVWSGDMPYQALLRVPEAVLGEPAAPHLWYLYAYIPLLLIAGVASVASRRRVPVAAAAALLVVALIPAAAQTVAQATGHGPEQQWWDVPLYAAAYALIGGLALARLRPLPARWRAAAAAGAVLVTGAMTVAACVGDYRSVFGYGGIPVAAQLTLVLLAVNGAQVPKVLHRSVASLAAASFGVYLVHLMVLQGLTLGLAQVSPMLGGAKAWWSVPLLTVATLAVSWALASWWRKARLGRELLG